MAPTPPLAGFNPPGSSNAGIQAFQSTLTPGYTGGFNSQNVFNLLSSEDATVRAISAWGQVQQLANEQEYQRNENLFNRVQEMRKREGEEAYKMQLPFRIGGMVSDIFQNIVQAQQPGLTAELNIRGRTPELLAQTYANNPYANRKWLS